MIRWTPPPRVLIVVGQAALREGPIVPADPQPSDNGDRQMLKTCGVEFLTGHERACPRG